jgi:hypothetical protein
MSRQDYMPSSVLPLAYFAFAHIGLLTAFLALMLDPGLPGGYFLHPRMVALVHLVTVAWISGSILGAFYIVAPLALGMPLPVSGRDWIAGGAFALGTMALVAAFWFGHYGAVAWGGLFVLSAIAWLGVRAARGLRVATAPGPVLLHVMLAFANIALAAVLGGAIGLDRAYGVFRWSVVSATFAHAHLAAVGWPMMMVVGLAYRLVPMFLPARMPTGRRLALSAALLQSGLSVTVVAQLTGSRLLPAGALLLVLGFTAFMSNIRAAVKHRLPRPPALPARDWSTWQTHVAIVWLCVAVGLGGALTMMPAGPWQIAAAWVYGVAGLVGFLAQVVVGIQGRLVPLYAYYRAMAARDGQPPVRAANQLPTPRFARPIFLLWTLGVPWLAWGLAVQDGFSVRAAAGCLFLGVVVGAAYLAYLMRAARTA